ncbi:MAG: cell division protein FtsQ/DivIB [Burkholderiaceae bacterium]|jgi:cell division protein FtsQ|nr:cell division protein FtsQ/DivIB [Burkholderiaceae bacterium]
MSAMARRFQPAIQTPPDVRLMNATTALLLVVVALAAGAAGLLMLLRDPAFAIQRIVVRGQTLHNDAASLRARVLPRLTGNFFTLSLAQAQAAFQSAPWVERAVVWRRWPGLLDVVLQERKPYARWGASGDRMLDVNGQLFDAAMASGVSDPGLAALPTLAGPDGQCAAVLALYGRLNPLVAPLHARLAGLQLQDQGSWRALLVRNGAPPDGAANPALNAVVELGSGAPDELAARLQAFVATASRVAARHQRGVADIETADLDYSNGYALRLKGVGTTGAQAAASAPATAASRTRPMARGAAPGARR